MKLVNTPTKTQPYLTNIPWLLVSTYKITTGSIKLVLDVKQFGGSSE